MHQYKEKKINGFSTRSTKKKEEMNKAYFFSAGSSKGFNMEASGA